MRSYDPPSGSIPTLEVPSLEGLSAIHLVGVAGAGMSGLARVLAARGLSVTGSDVKQTPELDSLSAEGIWVRVGHSEDLPGSPEAVVISTAIPGTNPEVAAARRLGIPVYLRAQVLAALMRGRKGVAVAGTHGKTTTTSMLACVLDRTDADATYVIGGDLNESGSNARSGSGEIFLAEADESDGSFLLLRPDIAIITNVDADHLDFYRDEEDVVSAFVRFARGADRVVACADDPGVVRTLAEVDTPAITYGMSEDADVRVSEIRVGATLSEGSLHIEGKTLALRIPQPGAHHLLNAAAAVVTARELGVRSETALQALAGFRGVRRRYEHRGEAGGASFVDDYAHHPVEVAATLTAARSDGARRIIAVFQPHRFSRTSVLGRELGVSLATADLVVVTDVYGAGEEAVPGVTGKLVVEGVLQEAPRRRVVYLPRRSEVATFLAQEVREGDLVLTLGAGDITMVGEETLAKLTEGGVR